MSENKENKSQNPSQSVLKTAPDLCKPSLTDPAFKREFWRLFAIGCLIGGVVFLLIYGYRILDFTNLTWLYRDSGSDLFQSQMGFDFFRQAPWNLPLGSFNSLLYPFGTSVVYTDSLPLFAIVFKIFNAVLPSQFQYFGLWGIFCYCLQGGLGAVILRRYIAKWPVVLIGSVIVVFSSVFLFRLYIHNSLAGQWIILLAILFFAYKDSFATLKQRAIIWSVLCALSVTIHPYFLAMIGVMMIGFVIDELIQYKKIKRALLILVCSVLATLAVFWLIGGFVVSDSQGSDLGSYSMNLNALFNRIFLDNRYLSFLKPLPLADANQAEGMQYLGIGVLILLGVWFCCKVYGIAVSFKKKEHFKWNNSYIPILFVCIVLTLWALSPVVTVNHRVLFSYDPLPFINQIMSTFRATGRLFWPVFYFIVFYLIVYAAKRFNAKKWFAFLLAGCMVLQILDMSGYLYAKSQGVQPGQGFKSSLASSFWEDAAARYKHIECLWNPDMLTVQALSYYALQNHMTINAAYLARGDGSKQVIDRMYKERFDLIASNLDAASLYVIGSEQNLSQFSYTNPKMVELDVDGFYVAVARDSMDLSKYQNDIIPENDQDFERQSQFIAQNTGDYKVDFKSASYTVSGFADTSYKAGSIHYLDLTFKNTSNQIFPSGLFYGSPVGLSYHWYDQNMQVIQFNDPSFNFDTNVFGGDSVKVHMSVQVPNVAPGKYYLQFDLIQGIVGWASDFSKPQNIFEVQVN